MQGGILPCLWRAPTDNDKGGNLNSYASKWRAAALDNITFLVESFSLGKETSQQMQISFVYLGLSKDQADSPTVCKVEAKYSIFVSGDVIIKFRVEPNPDLPPLPRVGVEFHIDKSLSKAKWYGRGPFECYPDRKAGAHVGLYEMNVADMHVPYIVPGECSGRSDVRWVSFQNNQGIGLCASAYGGSPPMQMSASYYSNAELDRATHKEELVEGEHIEVICVCDHDTIVFCILEFFSVSYGQFLLLQVPVQEMLYGLPVLTSFKSECVCASAL